jgi:hypothetical protein
MTGARAGDYLARVLIGGDVLHLAASERHVHPRVRIEQGKGKHFRLRREFPRDGLERRRVGDLPARGRSHSVAGHAARLREALAVVGIGSDRYGRNEDRAKQQAHAKEQQSILLRTSRYEVSYLGVARSGLMQVKDHRPRRRDVDTHDDNRRNSISNIMPMEDGSERVGPICG